jgi:hypothetical protein
MSIAAALTGMVARKATVFLGGGASGISAAGTGFFMACLSVGLMSSKSLDDVDL